MIVIIAEVAFLAIFPFIRFESRLIMSVLLTVYPPLAVEPVKRFLRKLLWMNGCSPSALLLVSYNLVTVSRTRHLREGPREIRDNRTRNNKQLFLEWSFAESKWEHGYCVKYFSSFDLTGVHNGPLQLRHIWYADSTNVYIMYEILVVLGQQFHTRRRSKLSVWAFHPTD